MQNSKVAITFHSCLSPTCIKVNAGMPTDAHIYYKMLRIIVGNNENCILINEMLHDNGFTNIRVMFDESIENDKFASDRKVLLKAPSETLCMLKMML